LQAILKFVHEATLTASYQLRLINFIISRIKDSPELRDETLCQAMKQTYFVINKYK